MDRSVKIVIVVLVVITVIFVITLAGGHQSHGGSGSNFVDSLKGLKRARVLQAGDKDLVLSNCSQSGQVLNVTGACTMQVIEGGRFTPAREVDLKVISGVATVTEQPVNGPTPDSTSIGPGEDSDTVSITFDRKGGVILVLCSPTSCTVQLTKESS